MATPKKYYTVWIGKKPGVYNNWSDCLAQVHGVEGARYKSYPTQAEAEKAYAEGHQLHVKGGYTKKANAQPDKTTAKQVTNKGNKAIVPSLSVDAACSGNPGKVEYQGVDTASGKLIFHQGPFAGGTNNLGEFLALVHALAYLQKNKLNLPIYTDSKTARAWVRDKKIKTTLARNMQNAPLFDLIDRALQWLQTHTYTTQILTWDTENWGEIPADFGRK